MRGPGRGDEARVLPFDPDRELLDRVRTTAAPAVRIYGFEEYAVVAGRGSRLEQEIRISRVKAEGIPVYRRMGGGCSVFLDPGNLIVSLGFPAKGFGGVQALFNRCSDWLIRGFEAGGIRGIYRDGISDLVVADRKIAGACFYRAKGLACYSAAILVTPDLEKMEACLRHPPREPDYRKNRSHREFVTGLDRFVPGISVAGLGRSLAQHLAPWHMDRAA